jgi:hypothetical protein
MILFTPVSICKHDNILGVDFNTKFATEMHSYYAPFVAKNRDIQVAKETWEYAVADSIVGANWCGAGHNVVDVKTPIADIDVKGISNNDMEKYKLTTEASFLQNNKQKNDGFAKLFEQKKYNSLKKMFVDPLATKIKGTNNLHLLGIIREKDKRKVYYCLLAITSLVMSEEDFISKMKVEGTRSVSIPLIDEKYGKTYIYIPKRRLELRLDCIGLAPFLVYSHTY